MEQLFSTSEVHPRDRFDYWHEIACQNLVPHDSRPADRLSFEAEIEVACVGELAILQFANSPMVVRRETRHCAAADDELFFCRQLAGSLSVEQAGRTVELEAQDMTLIDPRRPYVGRFGRGARMQVLKMPRKALEARLGTTAGLTIQRVEKSQSEGMLAAGYLGLLTSVASGMDPAAAACAQEQALDLVALALTVGLSRRTPRLSSPRALARLRLSAAVNARLSNPRVDVATIAADAGISVRYANALLAHEDTSLVRLLQARRLERTRAALRDPFQSSRTIGEIAAGWGFSDLTHFGRRFKAAYGMSPREYRRRAKDDDAQGA